MFVLAHAKGRVRRAGNQCMRRFVRGVDSREILRLGCICFLCSCLGCVRPCRKTAATRTERNIETVHPWFDAFPILWCRGIPRGYLVEQLFQSSSLRRTPFVLFAALCFLCEYHPTSLLFRRPSPALAASARKTWVSKCLFSLNQNVVPAATAVVARALPRRPPPHSLPSPLKAMYKM